MERGKTFKNRLQSLRTVLNSRGCDAAVVEYPVDLFYLTGLQLSTGSLLIDPRTELLIVDGRYIEACSKQDAIRTALVRDNPQDNPQDDLWKTFFQGKSHIACDARHTTQERYHQIQGRVSPSSLVPIPGMLQELRAIKDGDELQSIRKSIALLQDGLKYVQSRLREGMTEKELALEFEMYARKKGAEGMAFEPIIAFGEHAARPHHHPSDKRLQKGDLVLADLGLVIDHYRSDMTRTFPFGPLSPAAQNWIHLVQEAQSAAIRLCRPGISLGELDRAARQIFARENLEKYFIHSLGHGIGLETHEFPRIRSRGEDSNFLLKEGMVITIEPGLYFPDKGGVRIEDMIAITTSGCEILSQ
jgi:Xaa-Pro aminopeptidase